MSGHGSCLAVLMMLGLAACSGPSVFSTTDAKSPDVSLAGLSFADPGLTGQGMTIQLRLKNPNEFDIPVDGLTFNLDVNDTPFADGLSQHDFTLPSLGEIVVPIDVMVPTDDLIARVVAIGTGRRLNYRLTGEADIGYWFAGPVPFTREGKMALPSPPSLNDNS